MSDEFPIYQRAVGYLIGQDWSIICASPPGGTDRRFKKCLLPRTVTSHERGLRDEVDVTAAKQSVVLLIECKPRLAHSLTRENTLGESDYHKLRRILLTYSPAKLKSTLERGHTILLPAVIKPFPVLCVGVVDIAAPNDIVVLECAEERTRWVNVPANFETDLRALIS